METTSRTTRDRSERRFRRGGLRCGLLLCCLSSFVAGCSSSAQTAKTEAPYLYYRHLYPEAMAVLDEPAADRDSTNVVLFNLELGLAALALGQTQIAEDHLLIAYEYLSGGGINDPARTLAAQMIHEGHRVWTGEPYEQAMAFYYLSVVAMLEQDWNNARSGARNALFALRDIEGAAAAEGDAGRIDLVESEFVLGYLLVGLNDTLAGQTAAAEAAFSRVLELRPQLQPLVDVLRAADYDTLLIVDYGRGPRKVAYGPNNERIRFVPDGRKLTSPQVGIFIDGRPVGIPTGQAVVDLWRLAQQPKWWSLATARQTRSGAGRFLTTAGVGAAVVGAAADSEEAVYAGIGAALMGLALQASAEADARYLPELPRTVYLVPLNLGRDPVDVRVQFGGAGGASTWHELIGGAAGQPRVYYLRMHELLGAPLPPAPDEPPPGFQPRYPPGTWGYEFERRRAAAP